MKDEIRNVVYLGILILFAVLVGGIVWSDSQKEIDSSEMFVKKQVILIHENENLKRK
jgi:hypothetical protein